ncbi:MAG: WYL domain-containing protein [Longimicrobiales bacterium]
MPTTPSKLQRWLDVVAFLAARRFPVSTEELWEAVPAYAAGVEDGQAKKGSAAERMFERDKKELRELGIPIDTVTFSMGHESEESHGYQLGRKDFQLPYLKLVTEAQAQTGAPGRSPPPRSGPSSSSSSSSASSRAHPSATFGVREPEIAAALDGLREVAEIPGYPLARDARSAFRKLAFDLPPDAFTASPVVHVADAEAEAAAAVLPHLSDALARRKRITVRYHSMNRDETATRTLEPYGLLFQHGRWYLVARDTAHEPDAAPRMFRLGRMRDLEVRAAKPGTPDYTIPDTFDLSAFTGRKAWELGEGDGDPVQARVLFRFPRSAWAERNDLGTLEARTPEGHQLRSFSVRRTDPFLRWVMSLAGDARVESPPELRDAHRVMVDAVRARYAPPGGDA